MSTLKTTNIAHPSSASNNIVLDSSGNVNLDSGTLYVDASNNRVGIGTATPEALLDLATATPVVRFSDTDTAGYHEIRSSNTNFIINSDPSNADANSAISFNVDGSERGRFDSDGRLLVGTSSARSNFYYSTTGRTPGLQYESSGSDAALSVLRTDGLAALYIANASTIVEDAALGGLNFVGNDGTNLRSFAKIQGEADGAVSTADVPGRLVFYTTADGAATPTARMTIKENGQVEIPDTYSITTTNAANLYISSNGYLRRATSSVKYKTNIETLEDSYADVVLNCRPVWYRSTTGNDNPEHGYWGFIAEEVAEIDPRLVFWKTTESVVQEDGSRIDVPCDPEPEGVQYDRFVPHLLNLIKRQKQQIEAMEARLSALEAS